MNFLTFKNLSRFFQKIIVLGLIVIPAVSVAQINPQINYQGKLTDSTGVAVPDGLYNINFWLIDSDVAATSTAVWSEARVSGDRVQVTNGLFSTMLGEVSSLSGVDFNQTLYLGVEIGGTGTPAWDGEMSPRKILGTVPAAFEANNSQTLSGIASSSFLRSDEFDTIEDDTSSTILSIIQNGAGKILSLFSGVTEVFTVLNNGNVGIGTTTPQYKLDVVGQLRLSDTDGGTFGTLVFGNNSNRFIRGNSAELQLGSALNTIRFMGTGAAVIESDAANGTTALNLNARTLHTSGNVLQVSNAGSALMTVGHAGNVGIGTTTPKYRFDTYNTDGARLGRFKDTDSVYEGLVLSGDTGGGYIGNSDISSTIGESIYFQNSTNAMRFFTSSTERMRVTSAGNVGIGTTTPGSLLTLQSASAPQLLINTTGTDARVQLSANSISSANFSYNTTDGAIIGTQSGAVAKTFNIQTSGTNRLTVDVSGNVGIGTTTPGRKLNVATAGSSIIGNFARTDGANAYITFSDNSTTLDSSVGIGAAGNDAFIRAGNAERMRVTSTGNVGIGSTTPSSKLTVQGDAWIGGNITATGTLNITSNTTLTNASTTNLTVATNSYLGTVQSGVWNGAVIGDAYITKTGDWTGIFDGQEGTYYLARGNHTGTQLASTISDFSTTARGLFSNTATGLTYTSGTGVTSLTGGYNIPLTASTTEWSNALASTHAAVTITGENYLSLSGQQITANAIGPANLSSTDFGSFTCNGTTCTVDTGAVSNAMLVNSSVSFGGVSVALGAADATPAFNLADATGLPIDAGTTGTLTVARGGTGATSLTGIPVGNGTSAMTAVAGTGSQILRRNAGNSAYEFATLSPTVTLGTDLTGSATLTNLGSATLNATIAANAVTLAKFQQINAGNILGRSTPGTGDVQVLSTLPGALQANITFTGALDGGSITSNFGNINIGASTFTTTGQASIGNASTTNLTVATNSYLGTVRSGTWNGTVIGDAYITKTGDWTGTFDGQEGTYYLARANHTGTQLASTISDFSTTARALFSNTATGLTYTSGTGVTSLTSGYNIPLTASTTEWSNNVSSQWTTSGSDIYYNTGDVGIGTNDPVYALQIHKAGQSDIAITTNANVGSANTTQLSFVSDLDGTPAYSSIGQFNTADLKFSSIGNLVSPDMTLAAATGYLGIGTTTPGSLLTVAGNALFTGTINTLGTTGGYQIDSTTVLSASSTNFSTLVGRSAGAVLLSDGFHNTALGYEALFTATSSDNNTAVGYQSLRQNTTGEQNTANGVSALYSNTTGSYNNASGYQSLLSNTTGNYNTANGYRSLRQNSVGSYNTANGSLSLSFNTSGEQNTANGYVSLYSNTTGLQNTANGAESLYSNTTGSYNTSLGYQAGRYLTDGSSANLSSDYSLFLGNNTKALTNNDQNSIVIGYNANGLGSNTVVLGNDSITTTALKGNVGIGTTNPGAKLEVVGDIISKGTEWTSRTSAADNTWNSVTYGNGLFVAVSGDGTGNRVMVSPDGVNWATTTSAADNSWQSVTYGNGLFVAVASSGTGNRVMTSPDGINWTSRTSAANNDWNSVTYGNGLFVAVSSTIFNQVMTSPDGINWTSRNSSEYVEWQSVTYGNGLFVAVGWSTGGGTVMTSPDGITWTSRTSASNQSWNSVTYGNGLFVAVSSDGAVGNRIMTSLDGITWTIRTSAADNSWQSVTYGNGLFVAVASSGTGNRVMTSPDGINWTSRTSAANNDWNSVTYGNGLFVAVAESGASNRVMTSPDGINWTLRTSAADNQWTSVTYGNGLFVAVAESGASNRVMTSGKTDTYAFAHNNIYQGGMNIFGNVGIGTTTPATELHVIGTVRASNLTGGATTLSVDANGSIIRTPSDANLKTNVSDIDNALDTLLQLRGVRYEWQDTERFGDQVEIGFLAQEVDLLLPEVVRKGGEYWALNIPNMLAVVVEAVKELYAQVFINKTKIAEIEARLKLLEGEKNNSQVYDPSPSPTEEPPEESTEPIATEPEIDESVVGEEEAEAEPEIISEDDAVEEVVVNDSETITP